MSPFCRPYSARSSVRTTVCSSLIMRFPLERIGRHKARRLLAAVDEPDRPYQRRPAVGRLHYTLDHVALAKRRVLFLGDVVIRDVLPQGHGQLLPTVCGETKAREKRGL